MDFGSRCLDTRERPRLFPPSRRGRLPGPRYVRPLAATGAPNSRVARSMHPPKLCRQSSAAIGAAVGSASNDEGFRATSGRVRMAVWASTRAEVAGAATYTTSSWAAGSSKSSISSRKRLCCFNASPLDGAGRDTQRDAALENKEHDQGHCHGNDEGRAQCRHANAVLPPHHGDAKREGP